MAKADANVKLHHLNIGWLLDAASSPSFKGYIMPYSPAQNRLFWAAAHNEAIAKEHGLSMGKAEELAKEGVKKTKHKPVKLAKALMTGK